jgi:hypothetical protein
MRWMRIEERETVELCALGSRMHGQCGVCGPYLSTAGSRRHSIHMTRMRVLAYAASSGYRFSGAETRERGAHVWNSGERNGARENPLARQHMRARLQGFELGCVCCWKLGRCACTVKGCAAASAPELALHRLQHCGHACAFFHMCAGLHCSSMRPHRQLPTRILS